MTETEEPYDAMYDTTPRGRLHLAKQELHRALSDLVAHVGGVFPGDWTSETSAQINKDCCAVIAANWRHEEARVAAEQDEKGRRAMMDDTSPMWWEGGE
jgi:hypothetical protein